MPEYQTIEYGVPIVLINSARAEYCEKCGCHVSTCVFDPDGLIAAAAVARVCDRLKLSGREIRFLREALGNSAKELAATLSVSAESLSRWENNKQPMGPVHEKLFRAHVAVFLGDAAPAVDYDIDEILTMALVPNLTAKQCASNV